MEDKIKNEKIFQIVLNVIGILCGVGVIVCSVLFLAKDMKDALNCAEILLGVMMLVQGVRYFKQSKLTSIVSFVAAAIIFAAAAFVLLA